MLTRVRRRLGEGDAADRQFVEILAAVTEHGQDAIESACAEALAGGPCTSAVVLNHLARQRQPAPPEPLETAPTLGLPPAADCGRYDALRTRVGEAHHGTP
jgi:hypothetical protein